MIIRYDPDFIAKYKKQDVRIRKSLKERIALFIKDSNNPILNNHSLRLQTIEQFIQKRMREMKSSHTLSRLALTQSYINFRN